MLLYHEKLCSQKSSRLELNYIDMKIEIYKNQVIMEKYHEASQFDHDDYCISLTFNKVETKKLSEYYQVSNIEDERLKSKILNHYQTYGSLRWYQDFLEKHNIYGTLSNTAPLINS